MRPRSRRSDWCGGGRTISFWQAGATSSMIAIGDRRRKGRVAPRRTMETA